jgi:hypothetical protein
VTERLSPPADDEARLRVRYRSLGYGRAQVIRGLDAHRRALRERVKPAGHWQRSIVEFVAEHARNAGPTLYYLQFGHEGLQGVSAGPPRVISTGDVRAFPGVWLPEDAPILVVRDEGA